MVSSSDNVDMRSNEARLRAENSVKRQEEHQQDARNVKSEYEAEARAIRENRRV